METEIEILDTAGEDDYQNMMDMWITFGEGFLLVFAINDKESFEQIKGKYDRIKKGKHGASVPVILVGNKVDLDDQRTVSQEDAKKLATTIGCEYIETSAKKNINCREVFEKLATLIATKKVGKKDKGGCNCYIF